MPRDPRRVTRRVLTNSSAILAPLDADDVDYERAAAIPRRIVSDEWPSLVTTSVRAPC
jgi:hypothetical protein